MGKKYLSSNGAVQRRFDRNALLIYQHDSSNISCILNPLEGHLPERMESHYLINNSTLTIRIYVLKCYMQLFFMSLVLFPSYLHFGGQDDFCNSVGMSEIVLKILTVTLKYGFTCSLALLLANNPTHLVPSMNFFKTKCT